MKRIVILGDSLSMPRPEEGVKYENTYVFLLKQTGYEVINRSRRANDTKIQTLQQNLLDDIIYLKPDIAIIYLGIVDCAPRLFSRNESRILSIIPNYLRTKIIDFFSKKRMFITKYRKISYVSIEDFYKNLEKILSVLFSHNIKPILINIKENKLLNKKSFAFNEHIINYNNVIFSLTKTHDIKIIDVNKIDADKLLLSDGIHITKNMHIELYKKIIGILDD